MSILNSAKPKLLLAEEEGDSIINSSGVAGAVDWKNNIDEEFRNDPSIAGVSSLNDLAKMTVNAQKLIGENRTVVPKNDSSPEKWDDFYSAAGRPASPSDYQMPQVPEGVSLKEQDLNKTRDAMWKHGLSQKQFQDQMGYYLGSVAEESSAAGEASVNNMNEAVASLKEEWKGEYETNVDLANAMVKRYGGDELSEHLETTGLGNNPALIKFLANVGKHFSEDTSDGRKMSDFFVMNETAAQSEIQRLEADPGFMKLYETGDRGATERMLNLRKVADSSAIQTDSVPLVSSSSQPLL